MGRVICNLLTLKMVSSDCRVEKNQGNRIKTVSVVCLSMVPAETRGKNCNVDAVLNRACVYCLFVVTVQSMHALATV